MYVEMLQDHAGHRKGQTVQFQDELAKQLIAMGQAKEATPPGTSAHPGARAAMGQMPGEQHTVSGEHLLGRKVHTKDGWEGVVISHHTAPQLYLTVEYEGGEVGTVPADGVTLGEHTQEGHPGSPEFRKGEGTAGQATHQRPGDFSTNPHEQPGHQPVQGAQAATRHTEGVQTAPAQTEPRTPRSGAQVTPGRQPRNAGDKPAEKTE